MDRADAVSVASLLAIGGREAPPPGGQRQNLRAEIAEGRRFVFRDPILRKMIACTGTANLFGAMALSLEIIFLVGWIAFVGSWAAGWWVLFSPLRRMRDVPARVLEADRAPGGRVPGHGGGQLPDSAGALLGH